MNLQSVVTFVQFFFLVIIGLYFWNMLKSQQGNKVAVERESKKEIDKLRRMRAIQLSEPLSEKTRPTRFDDIVGQADGVKALRAALCGPNPQHVIIYGPPGVGKTAAARLVLEEAKKWGGHPFVRMRNLLNWTRPPLGLTNGGLPIPSSDLCMIRSIKGPGRWAWRAFRNRSREP